MRSFPWVLLLTELFDGRREPRCWGNSRAVCQEARGNEPSHVLEEARGNEPSGGMRDHSHGCSSSRNYLMGGENPDAGERAEAACREARENKPSGGMRDYSHRCSSSRNYLMGGGRPEAGERGEPCAGKRVQMSRAGECAIIPTGAPPHGTIFDGSGRPRRWGRCV